MKKKIAFQSFINDKSWIYTTVREVDNENVKQFKKNIYKV